MQSIAFKAKVISADLFLPPTASCYYNIVQSYPTVFATRCNRIPASYQTEPRDSGPRTMLDNPRPFRKVPYFHASIAHGTTVPHSQLPVRSGVRDLRGLIQVVLWRVTFKVTRSRNCEGYGIYWVERHRPNGIIVCLILQLWERVLCLGCTGYII